MLRTIVALPLLSLLVATAPVMAQTEGGAATAAPAATAPAAAAEAPEASPTKAPRSHATRHLAQPVEFEPASGRVKLKKDTYAYSQPSNRSGKLERVHAPKYVGVTGATRYYVRVKLKDGRIGYVPVSALELVRPAEKSFILTSDSPVYAGANRWAKRVAVVHKGHNVHVIGIALNYLKIKMKSGLEGFVPMAAVE